MEHPPSPPSTQALEPPRLLEVRVSVPDAESGLRIAHEVVARQLGACVQILGPMTSVFNWQGEPQQEDEWLLLIKTTEDAFAQLAEVVRARHRFEVPEVIGVPVTHALPEYGEWMRRRSDGISDEELLEH